MNSTHDRIRELIDKNKVVLFMKGTKAFPQCGFSSAVVEVLKREGIPFETINVLSDPEIGRASRSSRAGRRFRSSTSRASLSAGATSSRRCTRAVSWRRSSPPPG